MCLIAWNWQPDSETPLLLLANRDELYERAALSLHWWLGGQVLAGRDLQAGGTWLGVSRSGRVAALTNFRLSTADSSPRPSRGSLVLDFLRADVSATDYLQALVPHSGHYNPFNLLVFDGQHLMGLESRKQRLLSLQPGLGAVSNADFDTPWPKLLQLKNGLQQQLQQRRTRVADLLPLLQNKTLAAEGELPSTGVALELERLLSAAWIGSPHYGTRASSLIKLGHKQLSFFEQTYDAQGPRSACQEVFALSDTASRP
jgi:uncharacterized protein with NRDE domain